MTNQKRILALFAALTSLSLGLFGQEPSSRTTVPPGQDVTPPTAAPQDPPPPPPAARPDPPARPVQAPQQKAAPAGQWVYTSQYGWVWMPTGETYTYLPPDGSPPNMYVYYPEAGWCWVVAPWLWGWGPRPYFGVAGPAIYAWFGIGLGRWYGFAGPYAHWGHSGRAYFHGGRWIGVERSYGGSLRSGWGHFRGLERGWRR